MDPTLESRACFSTHTERSDGRAAYLDSRLQFASAIHLSTAGSLPPAQGSHRHDPAHRRSHASRCGYSTRTHSLGDSTAEHQLTPRRSRAQVGDAEAPAS